MSRSRPGTTGRHFLFQSQSILFGYRSIRCTNDRNAPCGRFCAIVVADVTSVGVAIMRTWDKLFMLLMTGSSGIASVFALNFVFAVTAGFTVIGPADQHLVQILCMLPLGVAVLAPKDNALAFAGTCIGALVGVLIYLLNLAFTAKVGFDVILGYLMQSALMQQNIVYVLLQVSIASIAGLTFGIGIDIANELWRRRKRR